MISEYGAQLYPRVACPVDMMHSYYRAQSVRAQSVPSHKQREKMQHKNEVEQRKKQRKAAAEQKKKDAEEKKILRERQNQSQIA